MVLLKKIDADRICCRIAQINPLDLPSIGLSELKKLPKESGIYFVECLGEIVYIGKATRIRERWVKRDGSIRHHKIDKILDIDENFRIYYLIFCGGLASSYVESLMVAKYSPSLNGPISKPIKFVSRKN